MKALPYHLMAKKKIEPQPVVEEPRKVTGLEETEAELRSISPTLPGLKRNNPAKYNEVYKRFMWLVGERDRLQNG